MGEAGSRRALSQTQAQKTPTSGSELWGGENGKRRGVKRLRSWVAETRRRDLNSLAGPRVNAT